MARSPSTRWRYRSRRSGGRERPPLAGSAVRGTLFEQRSRLGGGTGYLDRVQAVDAGDRVGAGAVLGDDELLVSAAPVAVLVDRGAAGRRLAADVDRIAVHRRRDRVQPAAEAGDLPLLVDAAIAGPLIQIGALRRLEIRDVDDVAAMDVLDVVGPAGQRPGRAGRLDRLQAGQQRRPRRRIPAGVQDPVGLGLAVADALPRCAVRLGPVDRPVRPVQVVVAQVTGEDREPLAEVCRAAAGHAVVRSVAGAELANPQRDLADQVTPLRLDLGDPLVVAGDSRVEAIIVS